MVNDPIAQMVGAEKEALLRQAPSPHAARAWHKLRARRAARAQKLFVTIGWITRAVALAMVVASAVLWRGEVHFVLLLAVLIAWLSSGACSRVRDNLSSSNRRRG